MNRPLHLIVTGIVLGLLVSCANISTPSGGKRDTTPPRLLKAAPGDSLLNSRITRVTLEFDEYVNLSDASKEIEVSPLLPVPPTITSSNKHVTVKIPDSLLQPNTTYRVSFGKAVRDLHEGNIFPNYIYTFSTGSYFDSATIGGTVVNAQTGEKDTTNVIAVLYDAIESDSAVLRKKPTYRVRPDSRGTFNFKGLPKKSFKLYAIKDDNGNMMYDGGSELISFCDSLIIAADTVATPVAMRLFKEKTDSSGTLDAGTTTKPGRSKIRRTEEADTVIRYTLNVDTSNIANRTFDIGDSLLFTFNKPVTIASTLARLSYDSAGSIRQVPIIFTPGADKKSFAVSVAWKKNKVYTFALNEGFAADTLGIKTAGVIYKFKTYDDDDYGKITVEIPSKFRPVSEKVQQNHVLVVLADGKPTRQSLITSPSVPLTQLKPAIYTFRIIVDQNRNGLWDTGDLLEHKQPEVVVPGTASVTLKAKWEHTVDFESKPSDEKNKKK